MDRTNTAGYDDERRLTPTWAPELVVLSFSLSWLGAYTCSQVAIHAKYAPTRLAKWWWTVMGSIVFGFSAIWCMHFVGMLACKLDVEVKFDYFLTILSALVSVAFTFLVLASGYVTEALENSRLVHALSTCTKAVASRFRVWDPRGCSDEEVGYLPLSTDDSQDEPDAMTPNGREGEGVPDVLLEPHPSVDPGHSLHEDPSPRHPRPESESESRTSASSDTISLSLHHDSRSSDTLRSSTTAWNDSEVGLSRESTMRVKKAQTDKKLSWKEWLRAHYETASYAVAIKAAIWGGALGFMHYCGMWAMEIPGGRIEWDYPVVFLSFIVAFAVCFIGCVAMVHMEVDFARQVVFSTLIAVGSGSMHYIGMAAATIYTTAPPSSTAGYPSYLPFVIVGIAVFVCVVSNAVLAHSATISRNKLEEMIITKRKLWRIMAEKQAAERANELKQQFISVASHEIRTPLHAVNGYCDLLALTHLTEEQKLYLSNIQQACHAINIIAGNVLDFSKLDRNNVELSARPVLVDLRKVLEDQARIVETKGLHVGHENVDVIVAVADDVPQAMYLDETYIFRILMNLLSNAQKFTEEGYIHVSATITSPSPSSSSSPTPTLTLQVTDTGCGIPSSFRPSLFQPFRQAHVPGMRPRQGTGLGLSIVKHLVQRMGGTIEVDSVEGEGTKFVVKIPVGLPTDQSGSTSPSDTSQSEYKPLSEVRVRGVGRRVKVMYANARTRDVFVDVWASYGFVASPVPDINMDYDDLIQDADMIWSDVSSVKNSPALQRLITQPPSTSLPILYIVHNNVLELASIIPEGTEGRNVVLVKGSVNMHSLGPMLEEPDAYMGLPSVNGGHSAGAAVKVRFALPHQDSEGPTGTSRLTSQAKGSSTSSPDRPGGSGANSNASISPSDSLELGMGKLSPLVKPLVQPDGPPLLSPSVIPPTLLVEPPRTADSSSRRRKEKARVLLVEDNMINQNLGKRLLEKLGYEVMTASDGQQAVDAVRKSAFECCLMDCQMPVLDGFAATAKIREMEKRGLLGSRGRLPVIALTANVSTESEDKCKTAGMDHFLPKPLRLADLEATLRNAISPSTP
ncbi:hypothetical protein K474DRAFT_1198151 [Panus rudis PR-1116 ss-1]|nr:hypothetical protein K474DRAFT_1198151 [Panus rudis PR-1116 ss-1]